MKVRRTTGAGEPFEANGADLVRIACAAEATWLTDEMRSLAQVERLQNMVGGDAVARILALQAIVGRLVGRLPPADAVEVVQAWDYSA